MNKKMLPRYAADYLAASNMWFKSQPPIIAERDYNVALAQYEKYKVDVEETGKYLETKKQTWPTLKVTFPTSCTSRTRHQVAGNN